MAPLAFSPRHEEEVEADPTEEVRPPALVDQDKARDALNSGEEAKFAKSGVDQDQEDQDAVLVLTNLHKVGAVRLVLRGRALIAFAAGNHPTDTILVENLLCTIMRSVPSAQLSIPPSSPFFTPGPCALT